MTTEAKQKCVCYAGSFHLPCEGFIDGHPYNSGWCNRVIKPHVGMVCGHERECHPTNTPKPITQ